MVHFWLHLIISFVINYIFQKRPTAERGLKHWKNKNSFCNNENKMMEGTGYYLLNGDTTFIYKIRWQHTHNIGKWPITKWWKSKVPKKWFLWWVVLNLHVRPFFSSGHFRTHSTLKTAFLLTLCHTCKINTQNTLSL